MLAIRAAGYRPPYMRCARPLTLRHHSPPPDAVVYLGVSRLSTLESRLRGLSEHECNPAGRQLKTGRKIAIKKLKVGQFTGELVIHQSHH